MKSIASYGPLTTRMGEGVGAPFIYLMGALILLLLLCTLHAAPTFAGTTLPGDDMSSRMESAGTLLRFIDTSLFRWGARILSGLCIFGAAWSLKEARYGPAVISVISAILFGTAPTWVKNIFSIGGSDSVFSMTAPRGGDAGVRVVYREGFNKGISDA